MFKNTVIALLATLVLAQGNIRGAANDHHFDRELHDGDRELMSSSSQKKGGKKGGKKGTRTYKVTVTNLSLDQPMSPFFAAVHSYNTPPLYTQGQPASDALALLAEDGNNSDVVSMYGQMDSVLSSESVTGGLLMGGATMSFMVEARRGYEYLSLASMAVNTNDCFIAVNGQYISDGASMVLPGLDSGTEENNELCTHIPGPACEGAGAGVRATENAEGFVHVHRGNQKIADLGPRYDWRNPMLSVSIERV